mgnify:FL=1
MEFTGKTSEEAIELALKELGITREQAQIEILEEGSGVLFFKKKARVNVTVREDDAQRTLNFLDGLFKLMNVPTTAEAEEDGDKIVINLTTTNSSAVIGYRGEVLDSLQCLAGAVANIGREDYKRVVVNCEGYREKREEVLKNLALKLADKAVKSGRKITLEPMNPFERRVIHSTLSDRTDVKTQSEGKEPNRYIAIIPENLKPYNNRYNKNSSYNKRDRRENGGKDGYRRKDNGRRGGGYNRTEKPVKKTGWGGTFLGNSLKNQENADKNSQD